MSDNTFERWGGNAMCLAGIGFGGAALLSFVGGGWGLFGLLLFLAGLRLRNGSSWGERAVDIVDDATDLWD